MRNTVNIFICLFLCACGNFYRPDEALYSEIYQPITAESRNAPFDTTTETLQAYRYAESQMLNRKAESAFLTSALAAAKRVDDQYSRLYFDAGRLDTLWLINGLVLSSAERSTNTQQYYPALLNMAIQASLSHNSDATTRRFQIQMGFAFAQYCNQRMVGPYNLSDLPKNLLRWKAEIAHLYP